MKAAKLKILWVPHSTWSLGRRQRDQYFIERLAKKHEIHVITWTEPRARTFAAFVNPLVHLRALRTWTKLSGPVKLHHTKGLCLSKYGFIRRMNQKWYRNRIRDVVRDEKIDIIIHAPSHFLNGSPPFDTGVPMLFDYVDYCFFNEGKLELEELGKYNAIFCVSKLLQELSMKYNKSSYYLPNGADVEKMKRADGSRVREKFGIGNKKVISLIVLTCNPNLFFMEALPLINRKLKENSSVEAVMLLVGGGALLEAMKQKADKSECKENFIFTGPVEPDVVHEYFAVTDVGTYPADTTEYYDVSCPIKIMEYTAALKPVVATYLKELDNLGFSNVSTCKPDKDDFAEKVVSALSSKSEFKADDKIKTFDWDILTAELERIIYKFVP